jgi:transporter family-2 protein
MQAILYLLTFVIGVVLCLHLAMNGNVGSILNNTSMGNALFWVIGGITAVIIGLNGWESAFFERLKEVPVWLLTAGAMGACLVFGIAWLIPKIGAGPVMIIMLAGQVICGLVFSHYGILGSPVDKLNWVKVLGALVMIVGVVMATYGSKVVSE